MFACDDCGDGATMIMWFSKCTQYNVRTRSIWDFFLMFFNRNFILASDCADVDDCIYIKEPQKQAFPGFLANTIFICHHHHIYLLILFLMPNVYHAPLLDNLIVSLILRYSTISFSTQQVTMKSRISWLSFHRQSILVC